MPISLFAFTASPLDVTSVAMATGALVVNIEPCETCKDSYKVTAKFESLCQLGLTALAEAGFAFKDVNASDE